MTPKSEATNKTLEKRVNSIDMRVGVLEQWKTAEDAFKAALKQVRDEDEQKKYNRLRDGNQLELGKVLKQVGIVLGLIVAVLYAYLTAKGLHP